MRGGWDACILNGVDFLLKLINVKGNLLTKFIDLLLEILQSGASIFKL